MPTIIRKTPGVYIRELDAFPPSVVGVPTAVPAFIGYTEKAEINGRPIYFTPTRIGSMADYEAIFGGGFKPVYKIKEDDSGSPPSDDQYDFKVYGSDEGESLPSPSWHYYTLERSTNGRFALYNSMRLFYANGGGNCYVVSVGAYGSNTSIDETHLVNGLAAIQDQVGPTMLVIPDAVLLPADDPDNTPWISSAFKHVIHEMLKQCNAMQDRVAILDVYGTQYVNAARDDEDASFVEKNRAAATLDGLKATVTLTELIDQFRKDVREENLNYGMAYFPFLETTVIPLSEINYTNIYLADDQGSFVEPDMLQRVLTMDNDQQYKNDITRKNKVKEWIKKISPDNDAATVARLQQNLSAALPLLLNIERIILSKINVLPPSGAMAGVYTFVDSGRGVWNAPANVVLNSVTKTTYKLNDGEQADLNVPVDGKAVDALRECIGRGTVVWGARTLDGNSNDWRYIQVRRTLIYIEQSIKSALDPFVFAANDGNTWTRVVAMVSNFLQGLWSQGGLMGATASEAYTVACGLGSTMTPTDILEGYMIVQITLQMIRPAEFIELTFKQKMEGAS